MSVAFRRESDEEHLEPKFEIPIPAGPNLVTARGLRLIVAKVAELEARLARADDEAAAQPLRRDLRYWQTRRITAELVPPASGETAGFGTRVTILHNGKRRTLSLVGDDEADPANGLLSFSAPLARAITGAEVGDVLDFGGVEGSIEVLSIEPIAD